jgi:hypothetical protein
MFLRRPFYFLWLIQVFEWTWSKGFEPPNHKDAGLFLTRWQGIAGMAARDEKGKSVFFGQPGNPPARYGLLPWQVKKTSHLKGILSVPILRKVSSQPQRFRCVGVINIDALTPEAAEILRKNETALTEHFVLFGFLLADLSV